MNILRWSQANWAFPSWVSPSRTNRAPAGVNWIAAAAAAGVSIALAEKPVEAKPASDHPAAKANEPAAENEQESSYLRITESGEKKDVISLEIASRTFERIGGDGPDITLVGVAHIGDLKFYRDLQKLLDEHDVVLFESVAPPGAGGARGKTADERIESTKAAIQFVEAMAERYRELNGDYPTSMDELVDGVAESDVRLPGFVRKANADAWGRPLVYSVDGDQLTVSSLGADGKPKGRGEDADISTDDLESLDAAWFEGDEDDNLQSQLAEALGLEFQLAAMDYGQDHWRISDMSIDQVQRALAREGADFGPLAPMVDGGGLPAQLVKFMLGLLKFADTMSDGAMSTMLKVIMIEMLGDESITQASLEQVGDGFKKVIVDERNEVAIDDVRAILEREPGVESVAVFYGAAHMFDLEKRLTEELSYRPVRETWLPAITVDLKKTNVSKRDLNRVRMMIRRTVRQQLGGQPR